ncbi:4-hydroxybenzoate octaprenyltransferase [Candidatus Pelagibacter sp.]|nr:4-hydroxybenzoate octaprenyltransferase [Candidatus Pelagibacter sp.]|tara:strand:- start:189 stop:1058 length:870 start_codon:yes stop_codon:yes gene_type:complete
MKDFKLFLDLIRIKKPIGIMLLFWPCLWGLTLSNDFSSDNLQYVTYLFYFFLGAVLMRSAGCIVNDILDRKYDILVERTKNRPIASGKISINLALIYVIILCSFAFLILIQFNFTTILLGLASMPFAFSYPLMKRYTYWPQLFLGFTFNYGLLMAWFSLSNEFTYIPLILYFGAIFWTLAYDTIYGFQDIKDDEIIGVKSTSIKFKKKPKIFIFVCYLIFILMQIVTGIIMKFEYYFFLGVIIIALHLLIYQCLKLNISNSNQCLKKFRSNNFLGFLVFFNIIINKIYL